MKNIILLILMASVLTSCTTTSITISNMKFNDDKLVIVNIPMNGINRGF